MSTDRPNILWISTHDINPHLGCYAGVWPGAEVARTPHLDRLAAEGLRFDQAFATTPVCAPSRSAIMTGCFPTSIGTHNMRSKAVPPPEVRLLSEYLRMAGYYTTNNAFTDFQVEVPATAYDDCSPTAHWRNRPEGAPFFAAFHGMATHESQLYLDDADFAERTAALRDEDRHDPATVPVPPYHLDSEPFRTAWARYHDLITVMDSWVGDILQQLEDDGLADDTIVVFWSDHGAGFPRAKRWATEAGLRVPLIIRWPGRISAGRSRDDVVHVADLAPTMLALAGVDIPAHMQMRPVLTADGDDLEQGDYVFGGRDRMDEQRDSSRTVRDRRYRLIHHRHPDRAPMQHQYFAEKFATWRDLRRAVNDEARSRAAGEPPHSLTPLQRRTTGESKPQFELYDVLADPHETENLADHPDFAAIRARLSEQLESWIERVGDQGLVDEDVLIESWRPGGGQQLTRAPEATVLEDGIVALICRTPGSLVAWTTDPPTAQVDTRTLQDRINGDPEPDERRWKIVTAPLSAHAGRRWARAWRLGFRPSEDREF